MIAPLWSAPLLLFITLLLGPFVAEVVVVDSYLLQCDEYHGDPVGFAGSCQTVSCSYHYIPETAAVAQVLEEREKEEEKKEERQPAYCVCTAPYRVTKSSQPTLYVIDRKGKRQTRQAVVDEKGVAMHEVAPMMYSDPFMRYISSNGDPFEDGSLYKHLPNWKRAEYDTDTVWGEVVRTSYCSNEKKNGQLWPVQIEPIQCPGGALGITGLGVNRRFLTQHAVDAIITRAVRVVSHGNHEDSVIIEEPEGGDHYLVETSRVEGPRRFKKEMQVKKSKVKPGYPKMILQVLVIERRDRQTTSFPGSFIKPGESPRTALTRVISTEVLNGEKEPLTLEEEQKIREYAKGCVVIYVGNVDDPRDTNWSWTEARMFHCTKPLPDFTKKRMKGGGSALPESVEWITFKQGMPKLYGGHTYGAMLAVQAYGVRFPYSWYQEEKSMELKESTALARAKKARATATMAHKALGKKVDGGSEGKARSNALAAMGMAPVAEALGRENLEAAKEKWADAKTAAAAPTGAAEVENGKNKRMRMTKEAEEKAKKKADKEAETLGKIKEIVAETAQLIAQVLKETKMEG